MKRRYAWLVAAFAVVVVGAFVARSLKARSAERAAAAAPPKAPEALELSAGDTFVLRSTELTRTLPVSGGLKAVNSAVVKARVAAEVKTLSVREGDSVKAGQVIGQLDTAELELRVRQAEQTAASAKAQLDIAKRGLENNRALVAQGFISATGLETSVSTEAGAQASYRAAVAATELARKSRGDARLVAPIAGTVSQRLVQPGERVAIDARLVEVVDLSRIELEAAAAPEDVGDVAVGQTAQLQVDGLSQPAQARVVRINPSTQAGTRAVMVYLALQSQSGLRQGLFAKGAIDLQHKNALAAPLSAVRVDQAKPYVLAVVAGKVEQRTVTLGVRGETVQDGVAENSVELSSGVDAGMTLLRGTAGPLRDGTAVRLATGTGAPTRSASQPAP